ncbi:b(0,+)-type amino acid transporter 1 [Eurytemora carolleeae]|uniref:b(0,+)-type amino acid transporter 1 n=1 Tax=Eurytemora carolleeae TaxID=1294199 RepID=UPI000C78168C|nr:b(0,+)-type amino acid transporter 1 [Eurytemora carolleeae]|eukprot:XP_023345286.1 b(0,+)-type amino acid transporter 1-like [Eurytemora affinis]
MDNAAILEPNATLLQRRPLAWNGEDYVAAGDPIEVTEIKPRLPEVKSRSIETKEEKRDSDQYLESDDSTVQKDENSDAISSETEQAQVNLKRNVGLFSGISLIVGTMIGSGIFVSPTGLLERTGSVGMSLCVWTACGVVSMLGALSYAELGTMITSSGAEYGYFMQAFGPFSAYMFSWVSTMIIKPSQLAIICMSFAEYAVEAFTSECDPDPFIVQIAGASTVAVVTFINCWSVSLATSVQNVFCSCKLIAVAIIIGGGMWKIAEGSYEHVATGFEGTTTNVGHIATAFYSGLWAYDGWNNLNYVTEEIVNPSVNLPLSIGIAIPLVTICYVFVNISYLTVMSPSEMLASDAVAVTFGNRILGPMAWLMPLSVAISTFGSANGTIFAAGRLCYVASREGHLVDVLSFVHIKKLTPAPALLFHAVVALAMVLSGDIEGLIDFFSFTVWIFYGMAMLALLVLRYKCPKLARPYKVPIIIPVVVLIISVYLVIAPIIDNPQIEYMYSIMFMVLGAVLYLPFVHFGYVFTFMDKLTTFLQLMLQIAPPCGIADEEYSGL